MKQPGETNSKGKSVASSDPKSDLKCPRCTKIFHFTPAICGHQNAHRLFNDPKNMSPVLASVLNNPLPASCDKPLLITPGPKPAANPTRVKEHVSKQPAAGNASPRHHPYRRPDKKPIQEEEEVNSYGNPRKKPDQGGDLLRLQEEAYLPYRRPDKRPIQEVEEINTYGNPHKKPEGHEDFLRLQLGSYLPYRRPDKRPIQEEEEVNTYGNPHKKPQSEDFLRLQVLEKDRQYRPFEIALPEYTDDYSPQPHTKDLLGEWMPISAFACGGQLGALSDEKTISDPLIGNHPTERDIIGNYPTERQTGVIEIDSETITESLDLDLKLGL
ncbi:hypothetical protein DITRI_Ditri12bG0118100 [Diplodiscus trichospermus]